MTISRQYLQSFHDAEFGTLSMDRVAGTAALLLHRDDGTKAGFSFKDVRMIRAANFLLQNVASRILLSSENVDRLDIEAIVTWTYTIDGIVCMTNDAFQDTIQRIKTAELQLFYVDPSIGCEVAVIARTVDPFAG
jgi:hypothetical protein